MCKHWLRGLCKKGDDCEFVHMYDTSRMPECYFFEVHGMLDDTMPALFFCDVSYITNRCLQANARSRSASSSTPTRRASSATARGMHVGSASKVRTYPAAIYLL